MSDSELAPEYVSKRDEVKLLLKKTARAKVLQGQVLDGGGLAQLLEKMVAALNSREIPSSSSMLDTVNQQLVHELIDWHAKRLEEISLPVALQSLKASHDRASENVVDRLRKEAFGKVDTALEERLIKALHKTFIDLQSANEVASTRVCERLESECEEALEQLSKMALPSLGKFDARSQQCFERFASRCVGPALERQRARLDHARTRERSRFQKDYNDRLYNGLIAVSLATIVVSRFVLKWLLPEAAGWAVFVFLEVYPKLSMGLSNMYESVWWKRLISVWELIVFNPVIDLEAWWLPLLIVGAVLTSAYRYFTQRRRGRRKKQLVDGGGSRDLDV